MEGVTLINPLGISLMTFPTSQLPVARSKLLYAPMKLEKQTFRIPVKRAKRSYSKLFSKLRMMN